MKLNKDTLAQEKARSHGYCWPYRQWVLFYGPNKNTALPVAVSKKFAEFATHCGTATSINAVPDFANSFYSLTKIGFNSSDGDDGSIFLMISLGQV